MSFDVRVKLWGNDIGIAFKQDGSDYVLFEYDKNFIRSGIELSPIVMPLSNKVYSFPTLNYNSFKGLPGLLADSLPDKFGNAVINQWLAKQGRAEDSFSQMERLCYIGTRGMGALEYEPAISLSETNDDSIEVDKLAELAEQILSKRKDSLIKTDDYSMEQIMQVGTSAGGARAKAILAINNKTGLIKSGQVNQGPNFEYWIMKFDGIEGNGDKEGSDKPEYCKREYAYYLMAIDSGIEMSESKLFEENGRTHFLTKRFDRIQETGEKLHMQSLAALAHYDFNMAGANSYEQVASIIFKLGMGQAEIKQLYRRAVFNIMARNQDDHVKNISFLMDKSGKWSLSPAYDITYAYNPGKPWTGVHQMSLNGKRDGFTTNDLILAADNMNIRESEAKKIITDVRNAIDKWPEYSHQANLSNAQIDYISNNLVRL